ncbi:hypothetical protein ILUMI_06966, partial [Ignelater luminosus]
YIETIQTMFSYVFLIQLLLSLFLICFLGFTFILVPVTSINSLMCMIFLVAVTNELMLLCIAGNEITLESEKIRDACYMSRWFECGPPVRKTLFIIMEKTKRPFRLSAANFVFLSLDTLISVFKSAFSYLAVLQRMYGDSADIL